MDVPLNPAPITKAVVIKNDARTPSPIKIPSSPNIKVFLTAALMFLLVSGVGVGVFLARNRTQINSNAAANVVLSFNPSQINGSLDQSFETTVKIDSKDQSVTGIELHVNFNPQVLKLESFDKGTFLPSSVGQSEIGNGTASITLIPNLSDLAPGKGQGDLAKLKFKVIQTPITPTEITINTSQTQISAEDQDTNALGTTQKAVVSFITASPSPAASSSPQASATASVSPSPIASSSPQANPKDLNGDGKINSVDLSIMYSAWGVPKTEEHKKADLNADGVVNGIDYSLLIRDFSP